MEQREISESSIKAYKVSIAIVGLIYEAVDLIARFTAATIIFTIVVWIGGILFLSPEEFAHLQSWGLHDIQEALKTTLTLSAIFVMLYWVLKWIVKPLIKTEMKQEGRHDAALFSG